MISARARLVAFAGICATVLAAACGRDMTTQPSDASSLRHLATSPIGSFSRDDYPSASAFYGTVKFTIDPYNDNYIQIGPHFLFVPANSVCDPKKSEYGVGTWTLPCKFMLSKPLDVIATASMQNGHPIVTFDTHLRFRPGNDSKYIVNLYLRDQKASGKSKITWCPDVGPCIDESATSLSPAQIQTRYDSNGWFVYRRIEHFSGYNVTAGDDSNPSGGSQ